MPDHLSDGHANRVTPLSGTPLEPGDTPGRCEIDKHGRAIHGIAWFEVHPLPGGHSHVVWFEDVAVRPTSLTRLAPAVVSTIGRVGFGRALRAMAREAERRP